MKQPNYWDEAKKHLSEADTVLARLIGACPDEHLRSQRHVFRTLANAIVGQQISVAAAESIWGRLKTAASGKITPDQILTLSPDDLRACGLSARKVEYLQSTAEAFAGPYRNLRWSRKSDDEIRQLLTDLRGIGPWTADMVLIFTFLRPDIWPLLDIGLVRAIERHYNGGKSMSREAMEALAEPWRPYRSVATWFLWRVQDSDPVAY